MFGSERHNWAQLPNGCGWLTVNIPSKQAGSEPGKRFVYNQSVMAIMANVQPESGQIIYYAGSDSVTSYILAFRAVSFFQRRYGLYCAEPTRIRSGWPGQGLTKLISSGSKLVCRNPRARFLPGRTQPARCQSFPLSSLDSVLAVLPQTSQIILCKNSPDLI